MARLIDETECCIRQRSDSVKINYDFFLKIIDIPQNKIDFKAEYFEHELSDIHTVINIDGDLYYSLRQFVKFGYEYAKFVTEDKTRNSLYGDHIYTHRFQEFDLEKEHSYFLERFNEHFERFLNPKTEHERRMLGGYTKSLFAIKVIREDGSVYNDLIISYNAFSRAEPFNLIVITFLNYEKLYRLTEELVFYRERFKYMQDKARQRDLDNPIPTYTPTPKKSFWSMFGF